MRASVLCAEAGSEGVVAMERGRMLGNELTGLSKADPLRHGEELWMPQVYCSSRQRSCSANYC